MLKQRYVFVVDVDIVDLNINVVGDVININVDDIVVINVDINVVINVVINVDINR